MPAHGNEPKPKEVNRREGIQEPAGLRPETLEGFRGQTEVKRRISITLRAAKSRQEPLPHLLLAGPPGLGKTTLAQILATEMGAKIHITSGPSLEKPADLAGALVRLEPGDVLFIDEIHRISPQLEEFLYPAMEDRKLDILIDQGGKAQPLRIDIEPFTLVGATTKPGNLTPPLRSRFQTIHHLNLYSIAELAEIVAGSAKRLKAPIDQDACAEIAARSRGTPRTANNNLLWVRDYARAELDTDEISAASAKEALEEIGISPDGLDESDHKILRTLCTTFSGGPVGLTSLAVACGEDAGSVEDVHEPYLIAQGYLQRTAQGRVALEKAKVLYPHPHGNPNTGQRELF